jgi:hypothetical protein
MGLQGVDLISIQGKAKQALTRIQQRYPQLPREQFESARAGFLKVNGDFRFLGFEEAEKNEGANNWHHRRRLVGDPSVMGQVHFF